MVTFIIRFSRKPTPRLRQRHGTRELREQRQELPQGAKANERNPRLRIGEEVIETDAG